MKFDNLKKGLGLFSILVSSYMSGFGQNVAEGRAIVSIEPFVFPAYANVSLQKKNDQEKSFDFEANHMGIINYALPLDSLEMKLKGETTYTGLITPSSKQGADNFEPFYTTFKVDNSSTFKTLEPITKSSTTSYKTESLEK